MKGDMISRQVAVESVCMMLKNCFNATDEMLESVKITVGELPSAQPMEDARAMCSECDAWNKYKNYPQPEQYNPCTVCQEFDCTGCKFRRTI